MQVTHFYYLFLLAVSWWTIHAIVTKLQIEIDRARQLRTLSDVALTTSSFGTLEDGPRALAWALILALLRSPVIRNSLCYIFLSYACSWEDYYLQLFYFLMPGSCDSEGVYTTLCVGPVIGRREDDLKDGMTLCSS